MVLRATHAPAHLGPDRVERIEWQMRPNAGLFGTLVAAPQRWHYRDETRRGPCLRGWLCRQSWHSHVARADGNLGEEWFYQDSTNREPEVRVRATGTPYDRSPAPA